MSPSNMDQLPGHLNRGDTVADHNMQGWAGALGGKAGTSSGQVTQSFARHNYIAELHRVL